LNPLAFADLPSFAALAARSIALPALGEHARAVGPVDALVLACAHRVAHHTPTEDPLWLFDIHLLAGGLGPDQWREFIATAQAARVARISASELQRAASTHHTAIPSDVIDQLALATGEASARHLQTLGPLHTQWLNLRDAAGWRPRLDMLRTHLFPPAGYMRQRYADSPDTPLPALYARRLVDGSTRWLREWLDRYRAA
ncbi:MAG TPA: hypothetical protein VNJ02_01590, partial [Vicinamibacterales bacterium]|nr:hypothetical protein [Vicinamibacterales bacterium]